MLGRLFRGQAQIDPVRQEGDAGEERPSTATSMTSNEDFEIFGDQLPEMQSAGVKLYWWDLWMLGVSTAIGGHFYAWNVAFIAGFGSYVIAYFILLSGYAMLALCMAELSSALPFAGGAYGITRVTLGVIPGFLVGCFDSYQSMFNALYNTLAMGVIIAFATDTPVTTGTNSKWMPLWWFLIYLSYMIVHIIGGKWMWRVLRALTVGSVLLLLIFVFGSIKFANFEENAPLFLPFGVQGDDRWFQGGIRLFLKTIPFPSFFFLGTESINLAAHDAVSPKTDLPRAYLLTYVTILCTSMAMFFVAPSVYPGTTGLGLNLFSTIYGYMAMFKCTPEQAIVVGFPAIYTSGFGFTYYYSSQIRAMGKSGLANTWLGYDVPGLKTPVPALLFGMVIGMLVGLRYYFFGQLPYEDLLSINLLGASATYCSQFISFIIFRVNYPTIKREFVSPLGIAGAVYGLLVFALMFIVVAGFENKPAIEVFAIYVGVLLLYYFLVVRYRQTFSEEEKAVLFKAYLIKSKLPVRQMLVALSDACCVHVPLHVCRQSQQSGADSHGAGQAAVRLPAR
jgi:ethanolamine permease